MNTRDSFHMKSVPHCGDYGYDKNDPRHIGRVVALFNSVIVRVQWENGWKSDMPVSRFVKTSGE